MKAKTRSKKRPRTRRTGLNRQDERVAFETMNQYRHETTASVLRWQQVLSATVDAADAEITDLSARIAQARRSRAKALASLAGLAAVVGSR